MTDTTSTTTPITTVVDGYIAMWNEADPARRRDLAGDVFTEDAGYVDPVMSGEGQDGIEAMVAAAQQQFPGHRFELTQGARTPTTTGCASRGASPANPARSRTASTSR